MCDRHTIRAKELLREHLKGHADQGVRTINAMADLPDDHPSVVRIADALRQKAQAGQAHGR